MEESIYEPGMPSAQVSGGGNDDARRLKSFLAARNDDPEVREVHVHSINDSIVLRELNEQELTDWQQLYVSDSGKGSRRRSFVEQSAALVALALVSPRPSEQELLDAGFSSHADMVRSSLKPVEVLKLGEVVMELSGGGEDAVEVAGN